MIQKNLKPQASSLKPQASSLKPQASSLKPQASSLKPQASSLTSSKKILSLACLVSLSSSYCYAVLPWVGGTDGSGAFTGGVNWVGDGIVQSNVSTTVHMDSDLFLDDYTSGLLTLPLTGQARLQTPIVASIQLDILGGGSADIFFNNRNDYDGGNGTFDGISFTDFTGNATGFRATITLNSPLAARNTPGDPNAQPMISGLSWSNLDGTTKESYEVAMSLGGVVSAPLGTNTFTPGLHPDFNTAFILSPSNGGSVLTQTGTSFSAPSLADQNFYLGVRGFDTDGNTGNFDTNYKEETYAESQTWEVTRDGGALFQQNSIFMLSLDGAQHSNYLDAADAIAVPEPSCAGLLGLGGLALILRRRK